MKTLYKIVIITLAIGGASQAATTIAIRNSSTLGSVGVPVLNSSGNAITSAGGRVLSAGYFSAGFDFATATTATIKAAYTPFATSTTFSQNGMFNITLSNALPANDTSFTGKIIYTLVGDASTIANANAFAIFTANVAFPVVDAGGNGAATSLTPAASNVVFGTLRAPNTQPAAGNTYPQGVQVAAEGIPEPSVALLGALGVLGLLRRRRN